MDAGIYFLALGEFQTVFEFGFIVTTDATGGGEYQLNFSDISLIETLEGGAVQFLVAFLTAAKVSYSGRFL